MPRTVISLDEEDKAWLDEMAKAEQVPMTELVRRAIHKYREELERSSKPTIHELLERTQGIWQHGDGLAYQTKIRNEWDK